MAKYYQPPKLYNGIAERDDLSGDLAVTLYFRASTADGIFERSYKLSVIGEDLDAQTVDDTADQFADDLLTAGYVLQPV
jgi:hypothetical protein